MAMALWSERTTSYKQTEKYQKVNVDYLILAAKNVQTYMAEYQK
jgi:hypothetical protein